MIPLHLFDVRYFLECVDGGSLLAGANRAGVTAAAMTKALQRLESALGVTLMTRTTRGARLTTDGERLVTPLRALADQAERVRNEASLEGSALSGEIRVLAMEVFSPLLLPKAIGLLVRAHPRVIPKTYESIPERMVELVASGRADVAFTVGNVESPTVHVERLGTTRGVLVCGRDHPLAKSGRADRAALERYPSVVPRFWGAEHLPSIDQFPEEAWPRKVGATIELLRMGVSLVEEGDFLGYFPEISVRREIERGSLVPLPSPPGRAFDLVAITPRSGARPVAEALVREVRALVGVESTARPRRARARASLPRK
jgi:DNA-binding transcriptional LysR family regulator